MNVLEKHKIGSILLLIKAGVSFREIERRTGVRRETVSKYAAELKSKPATVEGVPTGNLVKIGQDLSPCPPDGVASITREKSEKSVSISVSVCEPHRAWIEEQIGMGRNAVAIFQDLVDKHEFSYKYDAVKRFCRKLRERDPERFDVLEFPPGEEAQVDYGQGALTFKSEGNYKRPYLFVMTLKYSGKSFRKVVWNTSQEIWSRLHEEAFRSFGGCPKYVVLDNLKEGVITPDIYEPVLNPVYSAMLAHYGVIAEPCRVKDPDRKGTVESAIKHTQGTALKGRRFETVEEQNEFLERWESNWAAPRIHGRKKRQVMEMFLEEKPSLKSLPAEGFRYFKEETRTVNESGVVQVENRYYSALPAKLYSKVKIRVYQNEIEIFDNEGLVLRRHLKLKRAGDFEIPPGDRIFNPTREIDKALDRLEKIGPRTAELGRRSFKALGRPAKGVIYGLTSLSRRFAKNQIEAACESVLRAGSYSYRSVKKILERQVSPMTESLRQEGPEIRPIDEYQKFWEMNSQVNNQEVNDDDVYH